MEINNVLSFSEKNSRIDINKPNEDYYLFDIPNGIFIVVDGVSRSYRYDNYPDPSPSAQLAKSFTERLYKKIKSVKANCDGLNKEMLSTIILELNDSIKSLNQELGSAIENFRIGLVYILAIVDNGKVHYSYIGDCALWLIRDNNLQLLTNLQTERIKKNRSRFTRIEIENNIRNNINHPCGFGVLNGDPRVIDFIKCDAISSISGDTLLLASDGLNHIMLPENINLLSNGAKEDMIKLSELFEKKKDFKPDDKTIIRFSLF